MVPLILTILCSTSIALILKINSIKQGDTLILLTGNYISASLISLILYFGNKGTTNSFELIPLGLFLSILFVGSIFAFSKSVTLSGAALSTVSSRLSVLVPIILSVIIFNEAPNAFQIIGLIFTFFTIILFYFSLNNRKQEDRNKNKFLYLISILIGIGVADFFMKVFQENWNNNDKPWFLFWIFFFSFLSTLFVSLKRKKIFNNKTMILGLIMGVPNIFSSYFLIESLKFYNAVIVYPIVNISIILATSVIVKIYWREPWNLYSKIALFIGLISITLLSL